MIEKQTQSTWPVNAKWICVFYFILVCVNRYILDYYYPLAYVHKWLTNEKTIRKSYKNLWLLFLWEYEYVKSDFYWMNQRLTDIVVLVLHVSNYLGLLLWLISEHQGLRHYWKQEGKGYLEYRFCFVFHLSNSQSEEKNLPRSSLW